MLQMLDGNEHAACEAVGQGFKSLLQYQLPVSVGRGTVSKTEPREFESFHRCQNKSRSRWGGFLRFWASLIGPAPLSDGASYHRSGGGFRGLEDLAHGCITSSLHVRLCALATTA